MCQGYLAVGTRMHGPEGGPPQQCGGPTWQPGRATYMGKGGSVSVKEGGQCPKTEAPVNTGAAGRPDVSSASPAIRRMQPELHGGGSHQRHGWPTGKTRGEPGAVRVARRVRRAGRGNLPGVILARRPGPTQQMWFSGSVAGQAR